MAHSILAPSSASRRIACPGSRALEEKFNTVERSESAIEGDAAHWVLAQMLQRVLAQMLQLPKQGLDTPMSVNTIAPNGVPVTQEMLEGANLVINELNKLAPINPNTIFIEQPISISNVHPECFGTPDLVYIHNTDIFIFDYKFGYGYVNEIENWQLIAYAAGVLNQLNDAKHHFTFHLIIAQPRCFQAQSIRTWMVSELRLRIYIDLLKESEYKSMQPDAPCIPSPECKFCKARHACSALQNAALDAVEISNLSTAQINSPVELSNELRLLKHTQNILEARITGLEAMALSEIKSGKRLPHFTVEESKGRTIWTENTDNIATMGELLGINLLKQKELITPKQALDKGMPKEVVNAFSETPRGALKLIEIDDKKLKNIFIDNAKH